MKSKHQININEIAAEQLERLAAMYGTDKEQAAEVVILRAYEQAAGSGSGKTFFDIVLNNAKERFEYLTAGRYNETFYFNLANSTDPEARETLNKIINAAKYSAEHEEQKEAATEYYKIINVIQEMARELPPGSWQKVKSPEALAIATAATL